MVTEPYEERCRLELEQWRERAPSLLVQGSERLLAPAVRAVQAAIPDEAFRAALHAADDVATRFAARQRFLRAAACAAIEELRARRLQENDRFFKRVRRQAIGLAAGSGIATGLAGAPGLALDIPALVTQALMSIHRVGWCYGFDWNERDSRQALAVFALASANTMAEKQAAWAAVLACQDSEQAALRDGLERAAGRELSKQAAVTGLQTLARQLGINLGRRKALGVVPILGALVGGSVNAWYLNDVCQAARYVCLARRL